MGRFGGAGLAGDIAGELNDGIARTEEDWYLFVAKSTFPPFNQTTASLYPASLENRSPPRRARILNIAAALSNLDPAMEQAAQNLGCPPWRRLWRITLPLAMPGIFARRAATLSRYFSRV